MTVLSSPPPPQIRGLLLFRKLDDDVKFTDGEFYIGADFSPNRFPSLVIAFYPESSFSQISARLFYTEDRSYCRARHVITTTASFEAQSYDFPGGLPFRSISIELRWFPVNYEIKIAKDSEKSRPRFTRPSISLIFVRINCSLRYICC